jgi:hypothetical protein
MLVGWPPLTFLILLVVVIDEVGGTLRTLRVMFCWSHFLFCSSTSKTDIRVLSARNSTIEGDAKLTRLLLGPTC